MKEIAEAAGVTRQLVYFHYGNRAGLLLAMARHRDETSGFRRRALATRDLAPDAALEALLGAWLDYLPEHHADFVFAVAGDCATTWPPLIAVSGKVPGASPATRWADTARCASA